MKNLRLGLAGSLAVALMISLTGCGGLRAQRSVSPASFLLPGLIRNESPAPSIPADPPTPIMAVVDAR